MSKSPHSTIVNTHIAPSPPSISVTDDSGELPDGMEATVHQGADSAGHSINLQEVDLEEIRKRTNAQVDPNKIDIGYPIKILKTSREIKLKLIVMTLFLVIIAMTASVLVYYIEEPMHFDIGHASLYVDDKSFLLRHEGKTTKGWIGLHIPNILPSTCSPTNKNTLCVEWNNQAKLRIDWTNHLEEDLDCYKVSWQSYRDDLYHRDCFVLTNAHWYGGAEVLNQMWPMDKGNWSLTPYLTGNEVYMFGPVAERYWISSQGMAIHVDKDSPLFLSVNKFDPDFPNSLCLEAAYDNSPYPNANRSAPILEYTMCFASDLTTIHKNMSHKYFDKPSELPDESILTYPTWSTPSCDKTDTLNQSFVLEMAKSMNKSGFKNGTLEIQCGYTTKEGDLDFDPTRFPNPSEMVSRIHAYGFSIAVSVNPFSNVDSDSFQEGVTKDYWVREARGQAPGLSKWNRGIATLLDVSNPNATEWLSNRLSVFQQKTDLDYFTFDYGEAKYLPIDYKTENLLKNPCDYTTNYADLAYRMGNPTVMRSVFQSQGIPAVVQTIPKSPVWDYGNGMKSIIPTVLTLNIVGYPFVMLDMAYSMTSQLPDTEIFIRWIEIAAFLPAMKIPVPLWKYDNETVAIAQMWIDFHRTVIAPKVATLGKMVLKSGTPIIRPMWWKTPEDQVAQTIDSQFMIGDDLLVAPILDPMKPGETTISRSVYLPLGVWINVLTDHQLIINVTSVQWVDVDVRLEQVAYFKKVTSG